MKRRYKIALAAAAALAALALLTRDTPQEKHAKYLRRGDAWFEKGEHRKARLEYKNAAALLPNDPTVAYRWGLVDEAEGDIRSAFFKFLGAEQLDPRFHPARLKAAQYYLVGDQNEEAQKRVDAVLAEAPDDPQARALRASLLLRQKDFAAAEREARFALAGEPGNIAAISALAGVYAAQGDREKAAREIEEGIRRHPAELSLLLLKARLYENPPDPTKIREAYEAIFALQPEHAQFRIDLAEMYLHAGKPEEAESVLRDAIAALPADWNLKRRLIALLSRHRGLDAAEKEARAMMQAAPDKAELQFWLADLYLAHDQSAKAEALLQTLAARGESDPHGLNARAAQARLRLEKGERDAAETLINAVLQVKPNHREALFLRAGMEAQQKRYENAVSALRAILRDQPKAKEALQLLGETLMAQGYPDLAIETLHQLAEADPGNPGVQTRLAQMYHAGGDPKHALNLLAATAKIAPGYAPAAIVKASILTRLGRVPEALALYDALLKADPELDAAANNLASLIADHAHDDPAMLEKAQAAAERFTASDNPAFLDTLGWVYYRQGKPEKALPLLAKAATSDAALPEMHYHYGAALLKTGDTDRAKAALRKATTPEADYPALAEAKKLLAGL